mmetsp:Transcript_106877/g.212227  ORF Transcript_106877/g.212227 Transcript_106877/m.212227 type:complete len:351 (+) Transcript_106877:87-1139(+)
MFGMRGIASEWDRIYLPACRTTLPFAKAPVKKSAWMLAGAGGGLSLLALTVVSLMSAEPFSMSFSGEQQGAQREAARFPIPSILQRTVSHPPHRPPRTAVFNWLSSQLVGRPMNWHKVLDVGSGLNSLSWLANATCADITAVVASEQTAVELRSAIKQGRFERPVSCANIGGTRVEVLVGDWADPTFLGGGNWDAILADQLLSEIGLQSQWPAVARLASNVRRGGGTLLVVGQEPAERDAAVERMRKAMLLLAGRADDYHDCPQSLVAWELNRSGLVIEASSKFPDTGPLGRNAPFTAGMIAKEASSSQLGPGVAEAVARLANEISKAENASKAVQGVKGWKYAIAARRP